MLQSQSQQSNRNYLPAITCSRRGSPARAAIPQRNRQGLKSVKPHVAKKLAALRWRKHHNHTRQNRARCSARSLSRSKSARRSLRPTKAAKIAARFAERTQHDHRSRSDWQQPAPQRSRRGIPWPSVVPSEFVLRQRRVRKPHCRGPDGLSGKRAARPPRIC